MQNTPESAMSATYSRSARRPDPYGKEKLAPVVAEARNWTDLMRQLDLKASGGQRRVLQEKVAEHGLDTSHFVKRSPTRPRHEPLHTQGVGAAGTSGARTHRPPSSRCTPRSRRADEQDSTPPCTERDRSALRM